MFRIWKTTTNPGIQANNTFISKLLLADDQIILQKSEHYLQRAVYKLKQIAKNCDFKICANKTKAVAFSRKFPLRTKIVTENELTEQVSHFIYLGCDVTNKDITMKLNEFRQISSTSKRIAKKTRKETQIKYCRVMAVPTLSYSAEPQKVIVH
jgi:hypothetical protein